MAPTGEVPLSVSRDAVTINGSLKGSPRTRGKAVFSGDGTRKRFVIRFESPFAAEPVVTIADNQFAPSRIARVDAEQLVVEFQEAPAKGAGNVVIWWMAQE